MDAEYGQVAGGGLIWDTERQNRRLRGIETLRLADAFSDLVVALSSAALFDQANGHRKDAQQYLDEALDICRSIQDIDGLIHFLRFSGNNLSAMGFMTKAELYFDEAVRLLQQRGVSPEFALTLAEAAQNKANSGTKHEAQDLLDEATAIARAAILKEEPIEAPLIVMKESMDAENQEVSPKLVSLQKIPYTLGSREVRTLAVTLLYSASNLKTIGGMVASSGRFSEARRLLEDDQQVFAEMWMNLEPNSYSEMHPLYQVLSNRIMGDSSLGQAHTVSMDFFSVSYLLAQGRLAEAGHRVAKRLDELDQLLKWRGRLENGLDVQEFLLLSLRSAQIHRSIGEDGKALARLARAESALNEDLLNVRESVTENAQRQILHLMAELFAESRDSFSRAASFAHRAAQLAEDLATSFDDLTDRVVARSYYSSSILLAVDISSQFGSVVSAFAYSQQVKGRTLTELLEARGDLSALDRRELVLTQQHESGQIDTEAYNVGVQHIQEQRLARREAMLGSDPQQPMTLADIAASLRSGEALFDVIQMANDGRHVSFLVLPDVDAIAASGQVDGVVLKGVVTRWEQARASWVEAAMLLGDQEQRLRAKRAVADLEVQQQKAAAAEQRVLAELGNLLLGDILPVLDEHGVTTLIVSPDGLLHRLPLAALRVPDGQGGTCYLIERMAVHLVPTASALAILRKPDAARITWPPALLAAAPFGGEATDSPDGPDTPPTMKTKASRQLVLRDLVRDDDDEQALPASRTEVAAIADILGALADNTHTPVTLFERQATRDAVLTRLPAAKILHLSTHGGHLRRDDTLLEYRILLADKTQVTVSEVYDGTVSLQDVFAVCLSACHLGEVVLQGAEAIGFTQAFLQAGAGVILAPIWAVEDTATALLMEAWYRHLADATRPTIAAAWRQAALGHIAITDYSHPYFWAGFLPSGDGALHLGHPA